MLKLLNKVPEPQSRVLVLGPLANLMARLFARACVQRILNKYLNKCITRESSSAHLPREGSGTCGHRYGATDGDFICIKINFACHLFVAAAPSEFALLISPNSRLPTFFRPLLVATASRVLWPSPRSCAAPTTGPTHHYADWIITIAYIRRPYGSPAKDSVPARVSPWKPPFLAFHFQTRIKCSAGIMSSSSQPNSSPSSSLAICQQPGTRDYKINCMHIFRDRLWGAAVRGRPWKYARKSWLAAICQTAGN